MFFEDEIKKLGEGKIKIFVDMDGVIADYNVGIAKDYHMKRPLNSNIEKLERVSKLDNVEMYILSVARLNRGVEEKNMWLDEIAPFFKKENRNIIPREENGFMAAKDLKLLFVKNLERDGSKIVVIDDDPLILHEMQTKYKDLILYKDTVLVD